MIDCIGNCTIPASTNLNFLVVNVSQTVNAEMLPSSTANDALETPIGRGSARGTSVDSPTRPNASNILLALDSPVESERVSARKRRLTGSRPGEDEVITPENEDISNRASHRRSSLNDESTNNRHHKKKLSPSNSVRSLDSVAEMLERERTERVRTQNRQRNSKRSHPQRQSAPAFSGE